MILYDYKKMKNCSNLNIRPYKPEKDESLIFNIWQNTIGDIWPLDRHTFSQIIKNQEHYKEGHFVAEKDGNVIGFAATHAKRDTSELMLILVDKRIPKTGLWETALELCN